MRGRKRAPIELRRLHGNPSKNGPLPSEPQTLAELAKVDLSSSLLVAPDWLNDAQRSAWDYAIAHTPPRLLKRIDRTLLATWVVVEDLMRRATLAQNQSALVINVVTTKQSRKTDPEDGTPTISPYVKVINAQAKILISLAAELGFSPTARPRLNYQALDNDGFIPAEPRPATQADTERPTLEEWLGSRPKPPTIN